MAADKQEIAQKIAPEHRRILDEDGRCAICSTDEWLMLDAKAKREKPFVDDVVNNGPEC